MANDLSSTGVTIDPVLWRDKVNGNTYHAAQVLIDDRRYHVPFQYGYGSQYLESVHDVLVAAGVLTPPRRYANGARESLTRRLDDMGVPLYVEPVETWNTRSQVELFGGSANCTPPCLGHP